MLSSLSGGKPWHTVNPRTTFPEGATAVPDRDAAKTETKTQENPRHIIPLSHGRLHPDADLAKCRDCQVSCQSACKTSCTVGNQRCPK